MGRSSPGLSYGDFRRLLGEWGCTQERTARGGGHQVWVAPNGVKFTIQGRSEKTPVIFAILTGATAALGVTLSEFTGGPKRVKVATEVVEPVPVIEIPKCYGVFESCFCNKGATHDGDHLCECGKSWPRWDVIVG